MFEKYFDLLHETIAANGLAQCPGQIFDCNEMEMPLCHKPPKVVTGVGERHPYAVTSGDRSQISVVVCATASGYSLPTMVIFDCKHFQMDQDQESLLTWRAHSHAQATVKGVLQKKRK